MRHSLPRYALIATTAALIATAFLAAGPLNPPNGPVASTYKTLSEVEPRIAINLANTPGDATCLFRIDNAGSYYLTSNVYGASGKNGILINANNVTLDLNGFSMFGGSGTLTAITDGGTNHGNTTLLNGSVFGWGGAGVYLGNSFDAIVSGLIATNNAGVGIRLGDAGTAHDCVARDNNLDNFYTGFNANLSHCVAIGSATANGITAGQDSTITECTANFNNVAGIAPAPGCTISRSTTNQNHASGIDATLASGCTIAGCSAYGNTGNGIRVAGGCTLSDCSTTFNSASGITATTGCMITSCVSRSNTLDGMTVNAGCVLRHNTCSANGSSSAGIRVQGSDSRIESNTVVGNGTGITVEGVVNLVFANAARGNTSGNYSIIAGNRVGTIVIPPTSAAISGNSGGAGLGSTDPTVNFAY